MHKSDYELDFEEEGEMCPMYIQTYRIRCHKGILLVILLSLSIFAVIVNIVNSELATIIIGFCGSFRGRSSTFRH